MSSTAPVTAMPTSRNGSKITQSTGYRMSASRASGQHRTSRMQKRNNLIIVLATPCRSLVKEYV